ncbi:MAG: hypothetical protein HQL37_10255 [Alphaproteobacteria bacterium]|nr:hypothetical protein [Alphaproteobacteria bacterium]
MPHQYLQTKYCLVVASNHIFCGMIVTALRNLGLRDLLMASDAEEAIARISEARIDIVICGNTENEWHLNTVRSLRNNGVGWAATVPVICVVGELDAECLSLIVNAGANTVTTLPITTRTMLKHATRALKPQAVQKTPPDMSATADIRTEQHNPGLSENMPSLGTLASGRKSTIVKGISEVAINIDRLRSCLNAADTASTRNYWRTQLIDAAQRLVNLLALTSSAGDDKEEDIELRERINYVKELFFDIILETAWNRLEMIAADITICANDAAIVLGLSASLSLRLSAIQEIFTVMSGCGKINSELGRKLSAAWNNVERIREKENSAFELIEFSPEKPATKDFPISVVGSQAGVMKLIESRSPTQAA